MNPKTKSLDCLAAALILFVPARVSALRTNPAIIEVGDTGSISIPFENREGGISPIENVRLVVAEAPAWIDIDTGTSFMGPVSIYPGELMAFSADYKINSSYSPASPAGNIILSLLSDSTSFVPAGITWRFATDNGFKTMRGTCAANDGVDCGGYLSPDTLAPDTYLQFDGPSFESAADKIFLSTSTLVYFIGADSYESNAEITRVALTGYSIAAPPASFDALNFSTVPVLPGAGQNTFYFASRDNAGNTEAVKSSVVYADDLAPTVVFEIIGSSRAGVDGAVVIATSSVIKLTGMDTGEGDAVSGLNRAMYSVDLAYSSNTAVFYGEPFPLPAGAHTVYYTAFDNVENQGAIKTASILVATAAQTVPVTTVSSSGDGLATIITPGVKLEVTEISTGTLTSTMTVYTALAAAGLEPVSGMFYELAPGGIQFSVPAVFRIVFNPAAIDTNTVALYYFDGVAWSSSSIHNQRVALDSGTAAYVEGEITHTSLYALLRTAVKTGPSVGVTLSPQVLNLNSRGEYISAELGFSEGAGCFRLDTVRISAVNGAALAEPVYPVKAGGKKKGGYAVQCAAAAVKFEREAVAAVLPANAVATITVSGTLNDGTAFAADAALRTIKHSMPNAAGKK
jgi:hypothetical protein